MAKKSVKSVNKKQLVEYKTTGTRIKTPRYLQNRELSWLKFNERVLDQGNNKDNPLLERLNFTAIFSSNLNEFYMVRVGSITDLTLVNEPVYDNKSGMTPREQIDAINNECHKLLKIQEDTFTNINQKLSKKGLTYVRGNDFSSNQKKYIHKYMNDNVMPFLSPQIINPQHPFPHLENNAIYVLVRLEDKDTTLGIVPLPARCERIVKLPSDNGVQYTLLEQIIEYEVSNIFSMYKVKHTNIISVSRNADLDVIDGNDEVGDDYREHMKRILKKRTRLAPVRLVSEQPLSRTVKLYLKKKLRLREDQLFVTTVPLNMSYCGDLKDMISDKLRRKLTYKPFTPQWPGNIEPNKSIIDQISKRDYLLSYPYDSFDPMVKLLQEAAYDNNVMSIRITLYRLASRSRLAEALIAAAENGKDVTTLLELRARFDEGNNIKWSQRFEEAGIKVLYGLENYKVHSKVCVITRRKRGGQISRITQFGTGNYHEVTARLYTDFAYFTSNEAFGRDAEELFRNLALENISDNYSLMRVAPLQIKQEILENIDKQIENKKNNLPCGIFFKTNSVTDVDIIKRIVKASKAGVETIILCRGICCLKPGIKNFTSNVKVVSIVGRLLEHSRIYGFGPLHDMKIFLSSADLMTRNMDKRVEVAWPVLNNSLREDVINYIATCLNDTSKLRLLKTDGEYSIPEGDFDAQEELIKQTHIKKQQEAEKTINQVESPSSLKKILNFFSRRISRK